MVLGKTELTKLMDSLAMNVVDSRSQLQVNGFELTVARVETFDGPGRIGFSNDDRTLPPTRPLEWGENGWLFLKKGSYKIIFNEIVSIPADVCAIGLSRSSLLRMGVSLHTAVWDAGYVGRSEALLVVYNEEGLYMKKDARVLQLLFMKLGAIQEGYKGRYMGENI